MTKKVAAIDTALVPQLAGELRVLIGKLKRRMREQGQFGDLTLSQTSVLGRLYRDGPATVTELARAEGMRSQSMGAIVAPLQANGFITGKPDPKDGRQTILSITPSCKDWIKATRAKREDWLSRVIQASLSEKEQKELAGALKLLERIAAS